MDKVVTLKISLVGYDVWRRLVVPASTLLQVLHDQIITPGPCLPWICVSSPHRWRCDWSQEMGWHRTPHARKGEGVSPHPPPPRRLHAARTAPQQEQVWHQRRTCCTSHRQRIGVHRMQQTRYREHNSTTTCCSAPRMHKCSSMNDTRTLQHN